MSEYPPEFDADFYRDRHPDLAGMTEGRLREHFETFGRREGRSASPSVHREDFLRLFSSRPAILEIGPFCNPALKGSNVRYFDVMDADALRRRAAEIGYPIMTVPHVDYIDPNGDLSVVDRRFAAAFSAHCIEHQPDLIHHLQQVERLLEDGGAYFLLIPDKRYCFDHFIAEVTIANVVEAHISERRVHRLASVIEHRALTTHNDAMRHWAGDHSDPNRLQSIPARVKAAIDEFDGAGGGYVDVHAWQFTPQSFRDLCTQLQALGYTRLRPVRTYDTPRGSNEFAAILELAS